MLARTACVYFEFSEPHYAMYGFKGSAVLDYLRDAGFAVFSLDGEGRLARVGREYSTALAEDFIATRDFDHLRRRTGYNIVG